METGRVDKPEEVVDGTALDGALVRLVPCACRPILFLGTARGVVFLEVEVVVRACRNLAVVGRICRNSDPVAGTLVDGAGGVAGIGAFKIDLEAYVKEVLLELNGMVVVGCH